MAAIKSLPALHVMLLLFQSSGLCVQSPSIIPVPGYPLCLLPHLRSLYYRFSYPVVEILLSISLWTRISHLDYRLHLLYLPFTPASNLGYLAPPRTIFHGCQIVYWDPLDGKRRCPQKIFGLGYVKLHGFYANP